MGGVSRYGSEIELECCDRLLQFECVQHGRMDLPEYAHAFSTDDNIRPSSLYEGRIGGHFRAVRDPQLAEHCVSVGVGLGEVRGRVDAYSGKLLRRSEIAKYVTDRKEPLRELAMPVDLKHLQEKRQDLRSHNGILLADRVHEVQCMGGAGALERIIEHPFICQRKGHHLKVPEPCEDHTHLRGNHIYRVF